MTDTTQSTKSREVAKRALVAMLAVGLTPIEALHDGAPLLVSDLVEIAVRVGCSAADFLA